jgi:hypothetical protein
MMMTKTSRCLQGKVRPLKRKRVCGAVFWEGWMTIAALVIGVAPGYAQPPETRFELKGQCVSGATAMGGVDGYVPAEIDLSNDETARAIAIQGLARAREACQLRPRRMPDGTFSGSYVYDVYLYQGVSHPDPTNYVVSLVMKGSVDPHSGLPAPTAEYETRIPAMRKAATERAEQERRAQEEARQRQFLQTKAEEKVGSATCRCSRDQVTTQLMYVSCNVPTNIDLSLDVTLRDILLETQRWGRTVCAPEQNPSAMRVNVMLQYDDQAIVNCTGVFVSRDDSNNIKPDTCQNLARIGRQIGQAQQQVQAFLQQHKVSSPVILDYADVMNFFTNPFVQAGKTVALAGSLATMLSATDGVFKVMAKIGGQRAVDELLQRQLGSPFFVVSQMPKGLTVPSGGEAVLVGRVIGKTSLKMTTGEQFQVPHLQFVGVRHCELVEYSPIYSGLSPTALKER